MVFTPKQQNWKWYEDDASEPTVQLANENTTPSVLTNKGKIRLRVTVAETGGTAGGLYNLGLQFSTDSTNWYSIGGQNVNAQVRYADGKGSEGFNTTTFLTSDGATHGKYHESWYQYEPFNANAVVEMDFAIELGPVGGGGTYYFRLYDSVYQVVVPLNTGESYPSITYDYAEAGVRFAKGIGHAVTDIPSGLNVAKGIGYAVTDIPTGLVISKAIAYAVVSTPAVSASPSASPSSSQSASESASPSPSTSPSGSESTSPSSSPSPSATPSGSTSASPSATESASPSASPSPQPTGPEQYQLMRHGKWFNHLGKRPFWWAR